MDHQFWDTLRDKLGRHLKSNKSATLIEILLIFGIVFLIIRMIVPFFKGNQFMQQGVVWLANVLMIALVFFGQWLRRANFGDLGLVLPIWSSKTYLKMVLWSLFLFVITLLSFVLGSIVMSVLTVAPAQPDVEGYQYLKENPWAFMVSLLGIYLVSSFGEELVYRGFLIQRISWLLEGTKFQRTYAILISALVFCLAHYSWGVSGMVQTGFMGLVLGTFHIRYKNRMIVLILAHAYMDTLLLGSIYFS
ncbi:CPBP family glutamic-type intramembrane protease [Ulvibacterium sp.]|uniref:CPBP family glutamic-type intramembrane protease n=1 Tax=Ulvibacterium sp. TaxID=2665914 RepID=UPI00261056D5|nr:CPBP family glutamic-type intramembrane protease [Ulvibacterium sp.]